MMTVRALNLIMKMINFQQIDVHCERCHNTSTLLTQKEIFDLIKTGITKCHYCGIELRPYPPSPQ